jgi:DegV family protein with EDD domain
MIQIIADTTSALPRKVTQQLGIPVLPQIIIFGNESYRDDTELDTAAFLKKLRASSALPKTAAPSPAMYDPVYRGILARGDSIVVLCPSQDVSGTFRAATVAAQEFPGAPIQVVDTRIIAGMLGATVLLADRWAKRGMPAEEMLARLEDLREHQRTYFVVDTLEYLHKGGRIGTAKALVGEMLQVKPILQVADGHVGPFEQQRTKKRALARLRELIEQECPAEAGSHLCLMHADALDTATELANEFRQKLGLKDVPVYEIPPAIVVHAGPGVVAAGFFALPVAE